MKKKNVMKWSIVVCLITLVSATTRIGKKKTFNILTLENVKALAEESEPEAERIICIADGDLICPFQGIRVYDYLNYWSLHE